MNMTNSTFESLQQKLYFYENQLESLLPENLSINSLNTESFTEFLITDYMVRNLTRILRDYEPDYLNDNESLKDWMKLYRPLELSLNISLREAYFVSVYNQARQQLVAELESVC